MGWKWVVSKRPERKFCKEAGGGYGPTPRKGRVLVTRAERTRAAEQAATGTWLVPVFLFLVLTLGFGIGLIRHGVPRADRS